MQKKYIQMFLFIYIPLFLLSGVVVYYAYKMELDKAEALELSRDLHNIELQNGIISSELQGLSSDILFLAEQFHDYPMPAPPVSGKLQQISENFISFANYHDFYDQLRFIDNAGIEQLRINYNDGDPFITPAAELQNKSKRYYFKETMGLDKDRIFLSPFDLNLEKGDIEQPIKPVLRIATPLYNKKGHKLGIIVLNYMGNRLFTRMKQVHQHSGRQLMLLNHEGYWLLGENEILNWAFMYPERQQLTFWNKYPDVWGKLSSLEQGQMTTPDGIFTWLSVLPWSYSHSMVLQDSDNPQRLNSQRTWKIGMFRDADFIAGKLAPVKRSYLTSFIFLLIGLAVVSALITHLRVKQKKEHENNELLNEVQLLTNSLLKTALISTQTMQQEMTDSLQHILSTHWLSVLAKGSIFVLDENANELIMVAQQGLDKPLLSKCARLPIGKCLCGQAAKRREIIFSSCLDHQHEITFDSITEHGHICVPILNDEKLLGVLNLYVEHGHCYNSLYDDILKLITNVLVVIIERQRVDDELKEVHEEVKEHRDELAYERGIVEDTLLRIRSAEAFDVEGIRYLMAPVETTAGDMILSARRPNGIRHFMLGDFTGHGLPSALAGPAVADTFYAMTKRNHSAPNILLEINKKLVEKLPPHLFLAACFIEFNPVTNRLVLWNASLPEPVLFRSGVPLERYPSALLALGIIEDLPLAGAERIINLQPGDTLYAFTDGVIEASDADGLLFGEQRFEALLSSIITGDKALETVIEVIDDYQAGDEQHDDITMLEIRV